MLSSKHLPKNKPSFDDQIKLPKIPSRKNIQSLKKNAPSLPDLPNIKNYPSKQNISINKQNKSINLLQRKNSLDEEIKARLFQVEAAQKIVKNVLGGPQATVNLGGGDITNFQLKIQINRQILRKQRHHIHSTEKHINIGQISNKEQATKQTNKKCVSSKEITSESIQLIPLQGEEKLKMKQNCQIDNLGKKVDENSQVENMNRKQFNSERKPKKSTKQKTEQNSKVFRSIKEILQNPQKISIENDAKKGKKLVKFTIEQLENRLREMRNVDLSQSAVSGLQESEKMERKMATVKSTGMIPLGEVGMPAQYTLKNWNKIQFSSGNRHPNKQTNNKQQRSIQEEDHQKYKQIKYHKSGFEQQVQEIKRLEMKSYKSIEKMIENRKLLVDLQLMNMKGKVGMMGKE